MAKDGLSAICTKTESDRKLGDAGYFHLLKTPIEHHAECLAAITNEQREWLANKLGVSVKALEYYDVGWFHKRQSYTIGERDSTGTIIGVGYRDKLSSKGFMSGSNRGLCYGCNEQGKLPDHEWPVIVVEGSSDACAVYDLGLVSVGKPSAEGGNLILRSLLAGREVVVVGENDESGAGKKGMEKTALALKDIAESVRTVMPPDGIKDMREWVKSGLTPDQFWTAFATGKAVRLNKPRLKFRLGSDLMEKDVKWLWPGRFAYGKLSVIAGDPGLGKSLITVDLAARVSAGLDWPDGSPSTCTGVVMILSGEDDAEDTILGRFKAAGGDVNRLIIIDETSLPLPDGHESSRQFDISKDAYLLEDIIAEYPDVCLFVIDPISMFMGKADTNNNSEVRSALYSIGKLAERTGICLIAVTHLNKTAQGAAIQRIMGSIGLGAQARAAWIVFRDPDDAPRRLFLNAKNNLGKDTDGMAGRIEEVGKRIRFNWEPDVFPMTAADAISSTNRQAVKSDSGEWLVSILSKEPVAFSQIMVYAKRDRISRQSLDRFRRILRVRVTTDEEGNDIWILPNREKIVDKVTV